MSSSFDNQGQYSGNSILRYEKIFGAGFISSGGAKVTKAFCERLKLNPNPHILDIGSGIGGADFYMAKKFGATIIGVDLTPLMVEIAQERAVEQNQKNVTFLLDDVRNMEFDENSFDLIWSRDSFLHIPEKEETFRKFFRWLKPDGQLVLSDYAKGIGNLSKELLEYVEKSHYDLLDVKAYGDIIRKAGFSDVIADDWSELFVETLKEEQAFLLSNRENFLVDFTEADIDYLYKRWERKVEFCTNDDMHVGFWHGVAKK